MTDNQHSGNRGNTPLRILVFSGSMRADSLNTKLALLAKAAIEQHGGQVDFASMREFDCPSYDGDLEAKSGIPAGAQEFQRRLLANDAFILACPEYNGSMPGLVKNTIDWTSRFRPQPFNEKHGMLLSASPSMMGGNRSLWSLRVPFEHLGARIFPDMFSLATAHQALDSDGRIASATLQQRFDATIAAFLDLVEAARNYPCMKKAWVEFLGQQPDPLRDRLE
ncbi:MAG TPA: NAD(P)H-dependent oxidoreductase [Bacteroidia bacterium]|nr:NAD(P)H-dependent oxidoreductase [Bacteroidia bacterium]